MSVQTQIDRIKAAKNDIGAAIAEKGTTVPDGTKIDGMAALIRAIQGGGGGDYDFSSFLKIDEITSGTFVPTVKGHNIYVNRPSLKHIPRIMIVYTEDDVNTLLGSSYGIAYEMYFSSNQDPFTNSSTSNPITDTPLMFQFSASDAGNLSHTAITGSGVANGAYGLAAGSVYSAFQASKTSLEMTIRPFNGSTQTSSKRYWGPGALYKYLIGYEVV